MAIKMTVINQSGVPGEKVFVIDETPSQFAWDRLKKAGYRGNVEGFVDALERGGPVLCQQFGIKAQIIDNHQVESQQ